MSITCCTYCGANSFEAHAGERFTGSVDEKGILRLGGVIALLHQPLQACIREQRTVLRRLDLDRSGDTPRPSS